MDELKHHESEKKNPKTQKTRNHTRITVRKHCELCQAGRATFRELDKALWEKFTGRPRESHSDDDPQPSPADVRRTLCPSGRLAPALQTLTRASAVTSVQPLPVADSSRPGHTAALTAPRQNRPGREEPAAPRPGCPARGLRGTLRAASRQALLTRPLRHPPAGSLRPLRPAGWGLPLLPRCPPAEPLPSRPLEPLGPLRPVGAYPVAHAEQPNGCAARASPAHVTAARAGRRRGEEGGRGGAGKRVT